MTKMNTSSSSSSPLLLLLFLCFSLFLVHTSAQIGFTCKGPTTKCQSLLGYTTVNSTTYSNLTSFFGIQSIYTLFGANNLSLTTSSTTTIEPNTTVTIPLPCTCSNSTGVSDQVPVYTVQPNDGLFHISKDVFGGFVQFLDVAKANNVSNPDLIDIDQKLWIPLPCSCDEVDRSKVVHYAHKVVSGSSIEQIAKDFGVSSETLTKLNGITDSESLRADQILDVPLSACGGGSDKDSGLASNGTYILTNNDCTQCICNFPGELQCGQSNIQQFQNVTCSSKTDGAGQQGNGASRTSGWKGLLLLLPLLLPNLAFFSITLCWI